MPDALMALAVILFFVVIIVGLVREKKKVHRESLDDDIPGFDDWRFGTPDDPLPESAESLDGQGKDPKKNVLKFDPMAVDDHFCGGVRRDSKDEPKD